MTTLFPPNLVPALPHLHACMYVLYMLFRQTTDLIRLYCVFVSFFQKKKHRLHVCVGLAWFILLMCERPEEPHLSLEGGQITGEERGMRKSNMVRLRKDKNVALLQQN
ncbi:hypothetical protein XENOCAPTIV_017633 [Xenoophorus captivus]|uniref:Uncharacterized protein n=1 Tax=Xenoophorus captivus TaxID=1517983 RepID=A0ABV0QU38_9TELE